VSLHLTNTLTGRKEHFQPILQGQVSIYCCGVTVYDLCHLGHARSYIIWDVLRRFLLSQGYKVTFVQNFTDIDDKILNRAKRERCTMSQISERNIADFFKDMDALGILRADRMPRATKCLDEIRSLIKQLESKGAAYSVDGDVYFSVMKYSNYGKLSRRNLKDQRFNSEGRVTTAEEARKQDVFDFALWKGAKEGEPSFPSPWGDGRPGWHIECSAMVRQELGETIDIHLGGADLIFPHHENEIAQSEIATGKQLSRFWLHNGMVNVEGQKMSKSLGNFTTIRALLSEGISPMALRLFVLQAHYRKPLDFTNESLKAASSAWKGLNGALSLGNNYSHLIGCPETTPSIAESSKAISDEVCIEISQRFIDAMNDDLNTSMALSIIFELARPLKTLANKLDRGDKNAFQPNDQKALSNRWNLLVQLAGVLGLKAETTARSSSESEYSDDLGKIKAAIAERKEAKANRDYAKADKIRNKLKALGIELVDKSNGETDWIYL